MIRLEKLASLKPHERTDTENFIRLAKNVIASGIIRNPLVADRRTRVILDGHHRHRILLELGLSKAPVFFVDYCDPGIRVLSRNGIKVSKDLVLKKALEGDVYPPKTTKHIIPARPKNINIGLEKLK